MVLKFLKSGFDKVKNALSKTSALLGGKIRDLFQGKINEDLLDQLEQIFYEADLGATTSLLLTEKVKEIYRKEPNLEVEGFIERIEEEILKILEQKPTPAPKMHSPHVIMIVGVNGNGKTTTVAKLAKKYKSEGKKVLIAAADTFRAAACEQLQIWANKIGVEIVMGQPKADASAVAFDALSAAKSRNADIVIIDTAGRLHTRHDLMKELEKINRTCKKVIDNSPHETYLILDATIGQNAIDQAKIFNDFAPISGLILTKLDGTAKGGIVVSICRELQIPVKFIGIGEGMDDLEHFDPKYFTKALFGF